MAGFLFTSDGNAGVNSFTVRLDGALEAIAGSPFSADLLSSAGLSVAASGKFVYVSDPDLNEFSVMTIMYGGTLQLAKGSPIYPIRTADHFR